mmetsp:Transcript_6326/g.21331  ORF Transcript_6326/g.21331 Transcript_6326/m.21331 type:complete len:206 (-) Transcript_6326:1162-1779(-)
MIAVHVLKALLRLASPFIFTVLEIPLIGERDNAFTTRTRHYGTFRFRVHQASIFSNHLFLDQRLCHLDRLTLVVTNEHDAICETFQISSVLRLVKLDAVVLRLNLQFSANNGRARVTKFWNVDAGYNFKRHHPFILNTKFLTKRGLSLQITERHEIIRRVRRHGRHDASTLVHQDGHHRQAVNLFKHSSRRLHRATDQCLALESQ